VFLPQFTLAELVRIGATFDHLDYIFDLTMDGFRPPANKERTGKARALV